jgi:hypothetical protein
MTAANPDINIPYTNPSPTITFREALTGPYLTASAAYAAGFRGWPLVIMTAIAGRETGWKNDAPHTDTNGIASTGLWQINSSNTAGLTDPVTNAKSAFALAGGNTLKGLRAWALTPPGDTSIGGVSQPSPYPWGTVPPVASGDSGYYDTSGTFHPLNYSLTASQIAQAIYAYGQLATWGPATTSELNSANGWGTTGQNAAAGSVSPDAAGGGGTSPGGGGCDSSTYLINFGGVAGVGGFQFLNKCQLKALKGGALTLAGGAVLLFGGALVVISGLAGKGPLAPVVNVAQGYVNGAKRLPGVGKSASTAAESGPSESQTMRHDRSVIARERDKRSRSDTLEVNRKGGKPLRSVKDPWEGQGMAEDAA